MATFLKKHDPNLAWHVETSLAFSQAGLAFRDGNLAATWEQEDVTETAMGFGFWFGFRNEGMNIQMETKLLKVLYQRLQGCMSPLPA